jgi:hypothetical protein
VLLEAKQQKLRSPLLDEAPNGRRSGQRAPLIVTLAARIEPMKRGHMQ